MSELFREDLVWCARRLPSRLMTEIVEYPGAVFVAGGFVRDCISKDKPKDVDVFVPSVEAAEGLALRLVDGDSARIFRTDNALTLRGFHPVIQIIHRWTFVTPEEAIASFDFTIASAAIWWDGGRWRSVCHPRFYADLAARRLVYLSPVREEAAGGSMLRILKFYQRGYRIPVDSLGAVIARLVDGIDLTDGQAAIGAAVTARLHEVDPDIDPEHLSHLPAT